MKHMCLGLILLWTAGCSSPHFIDDRTVRESVRRDFQWKREQLPDGDLFRIFDRALTTEEQEVLMFLYAYMPVGDMTDYDGDFYLMNVRYALKAREKMPWGRKVPDREYRHFVLPVRVNNENLDESRKVFFGELKERVKGLSMYDAILEVNHWCHEKAVYTPSDARTSSPLATVKTASGRCGEESTLLVAALRSVGIPARQVYTPRWAHTDDNHAWVEAWADGKWHFLGACEPEPVLDLAWFNEPASRGMLMHTKVFGRYDGPEEAMRRTSVYTEINVTGHYAPTASVQAIVTDAAGIPAEYAEVEFKLYNYGEFYTVASKRTGRDGSVRMTAGKGDMLVWACKDGRFGFSKVSFGKDSLVTVRIDKCPGETYSVDLDITPPDGTRKPVEVTAGQRARNDRRMMMEDSVRNAYTATFFTDRMRIGMLAREWDVDSVMLDNILVGSKGNYKDIILFLQETPAGHRRQALQLLKEVSEKDLRDVPAYVFSDHLTYSLSPEDTLFARYILNPRIADERLTPYKSFFTGALDDTLAGRIRKDPAEWVEWCRKHIRVRNDLNPQRIPVSPAGVWKSRTADAQSRNVFFVAVLRSVGVPARIDEVTGKTQYAGADGEWTDADFDDISLNPGLPGRAVASYKPVKALSNPQYYSHYTLSRYENGSFRLLNFPEGKAGSWEGLLRKPLSLDAGYYMMVSGTRLARGAVLSRISFFNVPPGGLTSTDLVMRENPEEVKVIGSFDAETKFLPAGKEKEQSILQATGRGYFIVGILKNGQEPTNHALRDIATLGTEFENWGRPVVLLFSDFWETLRFDPGDFPDLPRTIVFGTDTEGTIRRAIAGNMELTSDALPVFIIADSFNRVVFISQGYTIGLGEQLMKTIRKL